MKTLLVHTIEIYVLAAGISFLVALLIKMIERSLRPRPAPVPRRVES